MIYAKGRYISSQKLYASVLLIYYLNTPTKIGTQLSLQALQYFLIHEHPAETIRTIISLEVI